MSDSVNFVFRATKICMLCNKIEIPVLLEQISRNITGIESHPLQSGDTFGAPERLGL